MISPTLLRHLGVVSRTCWITGKGSDAGVTVEIRDLRRKSGPALSRRRPRLRFVKVGVDQTSFSRETLTDRPSTVHGPPTTSDHTRSLVRSPTPSPPPPLPPPPSRHVPPRIVEVSILTHSARPFSETTEISVRRDRRSSFPKRLSRC